MAHRREMCSQTNTVGKKLVDFRCESGVVIGVAEIVVAQIIRHDLNDVWKLSSMHYWQEKGQEDGNHDVRS